MTGEPGFDWPALLREFAGSMVSLLGILLMVVGAALRLRADQGHYRRRNRYGVPEFPTYSHYLVFALGTWLGRVAGAVLLVVGGVMLVAGSVPPYVR